MKRRRTRYIIKAKSVILIGLTFFFCIYIYSNKILPALSSTAQSYLKNELNKIIEDTLSSYIPKDKNETYIDISYSEDGKVSSMSANVDHINDTRNKIVRSVLSSLNSGQTHNVCLPIGALFSNQMLYAKGPKVSFRVIANNNFTSSIKGEIIDSGINQTLHRLYIDFYADVTISLPLKVVKIPFYTRYLLSEVLIVGEVPENYTDINRTFDDITESEIDDINDFGA